MPLVQEPGSGTFHLDREMAFHEVINLNEMYLGADLLNLLRARTFRPYPSAYFLHEGRRVYVRIDLEIEDEVDGQEVSQ